MFIDKNSIQINSVSMGQYLLKAEYGYNKLWGKDTGRNLAGDMSGTLLGIYPKITLHFRKLTQAELNIIGPLLDAANQNLTYYDPTKNASITITTYTGDWKYESDRIGKASAFEISFIAVGKRP